MNSDLLSQGLMLLALGMGTVFVFLTLLVLVTGLMSSLVMKYFPLPPLSRAPAGRPGEGPDQEMVAAISAAIHEHRARRKHSQG